MDGWIKLHRGLIDSACFANPNTLKVWIWLMIKASHERRYIGVSNGSGTITIELQPGQLIWGRKTAAEYLGMTESMAYRQLKLLEQWGNIAVNVNTHFSVVTICNWASYQSEKNNVEQAPNNRRTGNEQAANNRRTSGEQHVNTNKELKKEEELNNVNTSEQQAYNNMNNEMGANEDNPSPQYLLFKGRMVSQLCDSGEPPNKLDMVKHNDAVLQFQKLYGATENRIFLERPYLDAVLRMLKDFPDQDPYGRLHAITMQYVEYCKTNNRIKKDAARWLSEGMYLNDWSIKETTGKPVEKMVTVKKTRNPDL